MSTGNSALAERILAALSEGDVEAFSELIDPGIEIHTQRGVRQGPEEARRWAQTAFDHLVRRYAIEELHEAGNTVVALARVQYVWRESEEVGDEWLLGIVLEFKDGRLRRWRIYDHPTEALEELEG